MSKKEILSVIEYGYEVWNGEMVKFFRWMVKPCPALGNVKPVDCDYKTVMDELGRIDYGIYA